jgi:gliding motility-associated-like protein
MITQPNVLSVTDSIIPAICSNTCDGIAVVTPAGGTAPYTYSWSHDSTMVTPYDSSLCVDTFVATVTDTNGCSVIDTIVITPLIASVANAGPDTAICQRDTITLSAGPASTHDWYQDSIGTPIGTGQTISFVPATTGSINYILVVGDSICSDTDTVVVYIIPVSVDAGPDIQIPKGLCTTLNGTVTNGTVFNWTPISTLDNPNIEDPEACPNESTTYTLTATNDSGCTASDTVRVIVIPEIPDGITPNGDGFNDDWELFILTQYPNCEVQVYNRWGELIFDSPQGNNYVPKFDGTYNNKPLPVGTYYYVIKFNEDMKGVVKETLTGPITIMR